MASRASGSLMSWTGPDEFMIEMAYGDSQKRITAPPSSTPVHVVVEANAIDHVGDDESLVSQVLYGSESAAEFKAKWNALFEAKFGSMDVWLARTLEVPESTKIIQDALRYANELFDNEIKKIVAQLADVQHWRALARSDPKQFRRQLAEVLRSYRNWLNIACHIKSHRPKNETQNSLIYEIKSSKPNWSFGQVAREYSRRTGKPMTAKTAERTYKRTKPTQLILEGLWRGKSSLTTTKA
jgi:hypothetical protein